MTIRCGIDTIEIQRVEASFARFGDRFLKRFFTPDEVNDCNQQVHRLAARIAAKEAVAKMLGTGIGPVSWRDIEIRSGEAGRPVLYLHNTAADIAAELQLTEWDISLTHTAEYASAMCVGRD